jgi:hypothetical protein
MSTRSRSPEIKSFWRFGFGVLPVEISTVTRRLICGNVHSMRAYKNFFSARRAIDLA